MRARLLFTAIFALLCLPLFFMQANDQQLRAQAVQVNLKEIDLPEDGLLIVHWPSSADEVAAHRDALRTAARISQDVEIPYQADTQHFLIRISAKKESLRVDVRFTPSFLELWTAEDPSSPAFRTRLGDRLALLPPLLAILLAFLTRKTILSLTCGVLLGVGIAITGNGGFAEFFSMLFHDILWKQILSSSFHLYILGFVILLSSTVAVITRMGGIDGMVHRLLHFARNSRSVQAVAYFLGLGIFFDDYANTIVVGNSCGPLFDKQKISRAKLAYIVDSTAAPVAGVAVLSTWVAYQISTYAPQLPTVGMDESRGYNLFLETIPYRFYCLFALMMVGI
ncbi:MAG: hypothetical protein QF489_07475, partial [Planctomycetota bacterium]|nr:hypothetical protein [Planctomycetota bacterium]